MMQCKGAKILQTFIMVDGGMQVCSPHNTKLMSLKFTEVCRGTCIHVSVTGQN